MKAKLLVGSSPLSKLGFVLDEIRGNRILDVGCGAGIFGYVLRNKWQDVFPGRIQFQNFQNRDISNDEPALLAGCDITVENVRRVSHHNIYDYVCLASADNLPFDENSFDTIICIEVLEHLTKEDAIKAIEGFKKIATQRIVITVPKQALDKNSHSDEREFLKISNSERDTDIEEFIKAETHKSSFEYRELIEWGFQIGETIVDRGLKGFLKRLRRYYRNNYSPHAGQILAVMNLNKNVDTVEFKKQNPSTVTDSFPDFRK